MIKSSRPTLNICGQRLDMKAHIDWKLLQCVPNCDIFQTNRQSEDELYTAGLSHTLTAFVLLSHF